MKRTSKDKLFLFFSNFFHQISAIKIVKPFFWTECCKCGNEFKREHMLYLRYPSYIGLMKIDDHYLYGCTECFKDKNEFINYLLTDDSSDLKKEYLELLKEWNVTPNEEFIQILKDVLVIKNPE